MTFDEQVSQAAVAQVNVRYGDQWPTHKARARGRRKRRRARMRKLAWESAQ